MNKNIRHCPINKSAYWPLVLIDLYGSLQGHTQTLHWMTSTRLYQDYKTENRMWRLMPENGNDACHWALRTPNLIPWPWSPSRLIWRHESAIPATAWLLVCLCFQRQAVRPGDFHIRNLERPLKVNHGQRSRCTLINEQWRTFLSICTHGLGPTAKTIRVSFTFVTLKWPLQGHPRSIFCGFWTADICFLAVSHSNHGSNDSRTTDNTLAIPTYGLLAMSRQNRYAC